MTLRDILEQNWHNGFATHRATLAPGNGRMDERVLRDKSVDHTETAINAYILGELMAIIGDDFVEVTEYDRAINGVLKMQRNKANKKWGK